MKKIINLTEQDLVRIIKRVVNENYERKITLDDFNFLDNGKRIFSGWYVEQSGDEFLIKNKNFPFFEFAVFLNIGRRGSAKEYPWGYEARSTGGSNYPKSGHRGYYTIERSGSNNIEKTFKHFLMYNYDSIQKTARH